MRTVAVAVYVVVLTVALAVSCEMAVCSMLRGCA